MTIFLKVGRKLVQTDLENILYIQSSNIYCIVHLKNGEQLLCTSTLKMMEEKLRGYNFVKTHRCYIVNLSEIRVIDKTGMAVYLKDERLDTIPISRKHKSFITKLESVL